MVTLFGINYAVQVEINYYWPIHFDDLDRFFLHFLTTTDTRMRFFEMKKEATRLNEALSCNGKQSSSINGEVASFFIALAGGKIIYA